MNIACVDLGIVRQERGAEARYTSEPLASAWQRFKVWLLSLLPIEPLL
jgi:hypothetical protein